MHGSGAEVRQRCVAHSGQVLRHAGESSTGVRETQALSATLSHQQRFHRDRGGGCTKQGTCEIPTPAQTLSIRWLVAELQRELALIGEDVYRHPDIAYKNATEAKGVQWQEVGVPWQ